MSSKPTNFLTLMNNAGKAFSSLDGMACCYQCFDWPVSVSTRTLASEGIGFVETLKNPANLFKNNLNIIRNNMKSNNNGRIVELPTFFSKKLLMRGQNLFYVKKHGEVILNWRTNYQIMPRFERSFINDKCIFQ